MVGFGLSGLCIYLLPCMGLRPLCLLLIAYESFGLLFVVLFGFVVSLWLMLVLFLVCLTGPLVATLYFVLSGSVFAYLVGVWLFGLLKLVGEMVGEGCPGHGPVHLLSASAAEIGFRWDLLALAWSRPVLPLLSNLAGPVQHFKAAILDTWRDKVSVDLRGRKGFRGGPLLDVHGSLQLLNSSHARERDKALLRSIMVGGVWNGFLSKVRGQDVPCRFCGAPDGDGHLFWEFTIPPLVVIRENPEFHDLMRMDEGHWPQCLLWRGWLPVLSGVPGASPWAAGVADSARYLVEAALGCYSSGIIAEWSPPDVYDRVAAASLVPNHPNVWSDGSLVLDRVTGVSSSGAGFFAHQPVSCWDHRRSGHVDQVRSVGDLSSCKGFCSVPRPLQSVQRAEMWGVILALQSSGAVHLGVDNLSVVRHVGRLIDGRHGPTPLELVKDGDLLLLIERMLQLRGLRGCFN